MYTNLTRLKRTEDLRRAIGSHTPYTQAYTPLTGTFKLVAGLLIACVRAKLSMRALESAYLNGGFVGGELLFFSR